MERIFSPDNPVMVLITKITLCVYLNILWVICCLPIVTAGASTTALFYVTLKMVRNEEGGVTRQFFRAFRNNFRQSTAAWLILLAVGLLMGADGYVLWHLRGENAFWAILTAVFLVAVAAFAIVLMYIFPLMARFENNLRAMFLNSVMIGMRFLLCTVLMAAIYIAMAAIVIFVFTPAIAFGEGLCAYLCSYLLSRIFSLCEPKEAEEAVEENQEDSLCQTVQNTPKTFQEKKKGAL